jgi:hypothetical protein
MPSTATGARRMYHPAGVLPLSFVPRRYTTFMATESDYYLMTFETGHSLGR